MSLGTAFANTGGLMMGMPVGRGVTSLTRPTTSQEGLNVTDILRRRKEKEKKRNLFEAPDINPL